VADVENVSFVGETFKVVDTDDVRVQRYVRKILRQLDPAGLALPVPYHIGNGIAKLASTLSHLLFGARGKLPSLRASRWFQAQFKPLSFQ
jgi:UDP-glucose 4-epimerase